MSKASAGNKYSSHEDETARYLKEHKILELLENLTACIVYERPDNLETFVKAYLEKLQSAKADPSVTEPPPFIDDSNIQSLFHMLDITNKGYISHNQYLEAMSNLRVQNFNKNPAGTEFNKISIETFTRECKAALKSALSTFIDY